jgi:hypothetical protein
MLNPLEACHVSMVDLVFQLEELLGRKVGE